jgi:hypothetical protein
MQRPKNYSQGRKGSFIFKGHKYNTMLYGLYLLFVYLTISFTFTAVNASTVSETFNGSGSFPKGSLVSVDRDFPDDVELSSFANSQYLLGVVNDKADSSINFNKDDENISVALSGLAKVLDSDANGTVERGDFIGASWLEGVGMKVDSEEEQELVGIAQEDFNGTTAENYGSINTPSGAKDISIQPLLVRLFDKENYRTSATDAGGVQEFFSSFVGKDISLARIVIGSTLFFLGLFLTGLFVTSSVKGSFISIGRNPMASASIHKGMSKVAVVSVILLITGAVVSYAVLTV